MTAVLSVLMCLALIGADQYIKYLVVEYLKPIEYIDAIDGFLRFRYVENTGAVFGSFATHTVFLTIFSIILLAFTVYFLVTNKSKSKLVNFCLLLMISGGVGNIIDRIRLKYVVDYIEPVFIDFAVFNFADILITVGAFILIFYLIYDLVKDFKGSKVQTESQAQASADASEGEKKTSRFAGIRKVKKAEVEGDKEAVVFNAVITGESPDEVLNAIKMGVDTAVASGNEETEEVTDNQAPVEDITVTSALVADSQTGETDEKAEDETTSDVSLTVNASEDESAVLPQSDKKAKKISVDSIDEIDFSLFE